MSRMIRRCGLLLAAAGSLQQAGSPAPRLPGMACHDPWQFGWYEASPTLARALQGKAGQDFLHDLPVLLPFAPLAGVFGLPAAEVLLGRAVRGCRRRRVSLA